MYHRVRQRMRLVLCAIIVLVPNCSALPTIDDAAPETKLTTQPIDNYENNVIDFDDEYSVKFSNKYDVVPWRPPSDKYVKDLHRYTIVKDGIGNKTNDDEDKTEILPKTNIDVINDSTTEVDYSVIPLELISTTENYLISIVESTTDHDLSVIPLSTTVRNVPIIEINQTVTLPSSTQEAEADTTTDITREHIETTTGSFNVTTNIVQTTISTANTNKSLENGTVEESIDPGLTFNISAETITANINPLYKEEVKLDITSIKDVPVSKVSTATDIEDSEQIATGRSVGNAKVNTTEDISINNKDNNARKEIITTNVDESRHNLTVIESIDTILSTNTTNSTDKVITTTANNIISEDNVSSTQAVTTVDEILKTNSTKVNENVTVFNIDSVEVDEGDVPLFTELDAEDEEVPEDYYDAKDVGPTTAPKSNALSVLVGLAGSVVESVVESVAERVVPKGIYDLFKRMQRQSEALEAERLRSREENGGLGQFGRGILKSISSGLSKPLSQLMAGAKDIGSLDSDRGFVASLASGVSSVATVATSLGDAFKDRVQAIYPGTVWCGDGHSATARSGELGLFFFTDTCCRQHDACKLYIRAGETRHGLTNTGLFTRSHCSCDAKFRECLRRTNSLVSAQIGLTYFNVLGPQCFRKAHPIVKCLRRTRITGQKCEEYELDYTKPKMWQWFDNETF